MLASLIADKVELFMLKMLLLAFIRLSSNLRDFSWKSHDGKLYSKKIELKAVLVPTSELKIYTRVVKVVSGHFLMELSSKKSTV